MASLYPSFITIHCGLVSFKNCE